LYIIIDLAKIWWCKFNYMYNELYSVGC